MMVYVNEKPVTMVPGMTVKHALVSAGIIHEIEAGRKVYDAWDNEIGLDGELSDGMKIRVT